MTINGGILRMDLTTVTEVAPGIRAACDTTNFLGIKLVNRPDGKQTLSFFDAQPSINNHSAENDLGFKLTEDLLFAIGIIAAAIFAIAGTGCAIGMVAMIVGIVAGVADGLIQISTNAIEEAQGNDAPEIGAFALDALAPIVWADSRDFQLTSAALSDSLQLGGTPNFG